MRETELAAQVVDWLKLQQWDVYQEVTYHAKVCDIVALRAGVTWAIECKTSFGLPVIEQAHYWRFRAHYSSVAVPAQIRSPDLFYRKRKRRTARDGFGVRVLDDYGIGLVTVGPEVYGSTVVQERQPKLYRKGDLLRGVLVPEQRDWAPAGNSTGARFTPFQKTARAVRAAVQQGPVPLKALIESLDHHYTNAASARNSLRQLIEQGIIKGVTLHRYDSIVMVEATTPPKPEAETP